MNSQQAGQLEHALAGLEQEKQHLVSEQAKQAKQEYDQVKHDLRPEHDPEDLPSESQWQLFNENIQVLTAIFKKSNFDEYVYTLSNPQRILILNFLLGLVRGLGAATAIILTVALLIYLAQDYLPFIQAWLGA